MRASQKAVENVGTLPAMPIHKFIKLNAPVIAAVMLALASPARAEPDPCNNPQARDIMARALPRAGDEHPVNVTFRTRAEGVKVPSYLVEQYPDEMPIILQYDFDWLAVKDNRFEVTLHFKGKPARLTIPFDAVTAFYDNKTQKCSAN
jgi:Stringent starvation protein B